MRYIVVAIVLMISSQHLFAQGRWNWVATSAGYQMPACNCANCRTVRARANQQAQQPVEQPGSSGKIFRLKTEDTQKEKIYETPPDAVEAFLDICPLGKDDVLLDLGCGRGKVLLAAVKRYGCFGLGVDNDRELVDVARAARDDAGLTERIDIVYTDARRHRALYRGVTVAYMYLHGHDSQEMIDKLPEGTIVITYQFEVPGHTCHRIRRGGHTFYLVEK